MEKKKSEVPKVDKSNNNSKSSNDVCEGLSQGLVFNIIKSKESIS